MEATEPVRRRSEIEDPTNLYFVHLLSNRLVPLCARLGVPPNVVSLTGMACGLLAGLAYYRVGDTRFTIVGFVLMIGWHVMDGVDGQLARLTGSQSQLGKILDGICDYVTFTAVYVGLALAASRQLGGWVWGVVVLAGLCHAVQSAIYETQRQDYNLFCRGDVAEQQPHLRQGAADRVGATPTRRLAARLDRAYQRLQRLALVPDGPSRAVLAASVDPRDRSAAAVRLLYRETFAPAVRRWSVMSANMHTLAIFLFALADRPVLYFVWEIVGLSVLSMLLLHRQDARYRRFLSRLERVG